MAKRLSVKVPVINDEDVTTPTENFEKR